MSFKVSGSGGTSLGALKSCAKIGSPETKTKDKQKNNWGFYKKKERDKQKKQLVIFTKRKKPTEERRFFFFFYKLKERK